jgi:hypothetical protein
MAPSSPVLSLSSDTIQQVGRENLAAGDIMEMLSTLKNKAVSMEEWPYHAMEKSGLVVFS